MFTNTVIQMMQCAYDSKRIGKCAALACPSDRCSRHAMAGAVLSVILFGECEQIPLVLSRPGLIIPCIKA